MKKVLNTFNFGLSFFIVLLISFAVFFTACQKEIPTLTLETISINDISKNEVVSLVETNVLYEYKVLYEKQTPVSLKEYQIAFINSADAESDYNRLVSHKKSLELDEMSYTSFKTKLDVEKSKYELKDNFTMTFKAAVIYELPTNNTDSETGKPIVSEGIDYYDFEIVKVNNKYLIKSKKKVEDFPFFGSANFFRSDNNNDTDGSRSVASYSATDAVNFAVTKYNNIPTTGYYDYSNDGGDCTNFLSHCLKSGGWTQVNKWHWLSNGTSCDYNMTTCKRSPSWAGAAKFYEYITNGGASRVSSKFSDIEVYYWYSLPSTREAFRNATSTVSNGDIIQLSNTTDKSTVHHSTIVTSKDATAKKIFVTYRNATGYPVAKDKFIGDFTGGQRLQGFAVKATF